MLFIILYYNPTILYSAISYNLILQCYTPIRILFTTLYSNKRLINNGLNNYLHIIIYGLNNYLHILEINNFWLKNAFRLDIIITGTN